MNKDDDDMGLEMLIQWGIYSPYSIWTANQIIPLPKVRSILNNSHDSDQDVVNILIVAPHNEKFTDQDLLELYENHKTLLIDRSGTFDELNNIAKAYRDRHCSIFVSEERGLIDTYRLYNISFLKINLPYTVCLLDQPMDFNNFNGTKTRLSTFGYFYVQANYMKLMSSNSIWIEIDIDKDFTLVIDLPARLDRYEGLANILSLLHDLARQSSIRKWLKIILPSSISVYGEVQLDPFVYHRSYLCMLATKTTREQVSKTEFHTVITLDKPFVMYYRNKHTNKVEHYSYVKQLFT